MCPKPKPHKPRVAKVLKGTNVQRSIARLSKSRRRVPVSRRKLRKVRTSKIKRAFLKSKRAVAKIKCDPVPGQPRYD